MALVLSGAVVPLPPGAEDEVFPGHVWLGDDGLVAAVTRDGDAEPPGFSAAARVDVGSSFVLPGFVDLHSHLGYNPLPLWAEPTQTTPYLHHDIWPGEASYGSDVGWPAWVLMDGAPESVFAYVQVRALAGGTTTIQGWPSASRPPTNRLVRSVDDDRLGPRADPVLVSALTMGIDQLQRRAQRREDSSIFVYHCAEGRPGSRVVEEFLDLDPGGCLAPWLVAIHACALDRTHFATWASAQPAGAAGAPGTVVWSPFSNLWLYGITTAVPDARAAGLEVCLGTDWGPSGTKNLLGELKVARLWSDHEGWDLSDHDLVRMVTTAPGDVLGQAWSTPVGRLVPGAVGDAVVMARREDDPWRSVVAGREDDVELVVVGGRARFGTRALMAAAGEGRTTSVPVRGGTRRVTLVRPDDPAKVWTWSDVRARLDGVRDLAARRPPVPAGLSCGAAAAGPASAGSGGDPAGTPPIVVSLDMPGPGATVVAGPPPAGRTVVIPPIEPLHHDRRWLASVRGRGFHGGVLDGLARFYR